MHWRSDWYLGESQSLNFVGAGSDDGLVAATMLRKREKCGAAPMTKAGSRTSRPGEARDGHPVRAALVASICAAARGPKKDRASREGRTRVRARPKVGRAEGRPEQPKRRARVEPA